MTKENALKKLNKLTGTMKNTIYMDGNMVCATFKEQGETLSFFVQEGNIVVISTKTIGLENDSMTDMFYDTFHRNLTQAINFIDRV